MNNSDGYIRCLNPAHFLMKQIITIGCLLVLPLFAQAQVGIGTASPAPSAALDIASTDRGILIPRMTEVQRLAIQNPATGLLVFQSGNNIGFYYFDGNIWNKFALIPTSNTPSSNETLLYTTQGF